MLFWLAEVARGELVEAGTLTFVALRIDMVAVVNELSTLKNSF